MGPRPGHPHIAIIVITDGISNVNAAKTILNAERVHASNIFQQVYAVRINDAHITELNAIASDPSLVFNSGTLTGKAVEQLQYDLSNTLCPLN